MFLGNKICRFNFLTVKEIKAVKTAINKGFMIKEIGRLNVLTLKEIKELKTAVNKCSSIKKICRFNLVQSTNKTIQYCSFVL